MDEKRSFEGWAILELMGHRRLAGYVREVELAGHGFLRLDIPADGDAAAATQFYAPGAVYALTPSTEQTCRAVRQRPEPVSVWELPRPALEPARAYTGADPQDEDDDEEEGF